MYTQVIMVVAVALGALLTLHLLASLIVRSDQTLPRPRWKWLETFIYWLALISVVALAGTSFYATFEHGKMEGWLIWWHLIAAGAFVAALPLLALVWSHVCRFGVTPTPTPNPATIPAPKPKANPAPNRVPNPTSNSISQPDSPAAAANIPNENAKPSDTQTNQADAGTGASGASSQSNVQPDSDQPNSDQASSGQADSDQANSSSETRNQSADQQSGDDEEMSSAGYELAAAISASSRPSTSSESSESPGQASTESNPFKDGYDAMGPPIIPPKFGVSTRLAYWLILVTGLISAATMLVSMLPVFGTEDMLLLLDLHRYSGLILVAAFTIHFYRIFLERVGKG